MTKILHRFQSHIATRSQAHDKLEDMLIELRGRGINFDINQVAQDGEEYFVAKSVDYPRGTIITSGTTADELERNIKDAIFTAFEVPVRFCHPALINIQGQFFATKNYVSQETEKQLIHVTT
jgi:hypothetical protein